MSAESERRNNMSVKRLKAMTLIEILAAVMIFTLAVLVTFATFNLAMKLTRVAREFSIATNLAEQKVESYRAMNFNDITVPVVGTPTAVPELPGGFMTVSTSNYNANDKIIQITVQVYWANRPQSRAITISTLKSPGGING